MAGVFQFPKALAEGLLPARHLKIRKMVEMVAVCLMTLEPLATH